MLLVSETFTGSHWSLDFVQVPCHGAKGPPQSDLNLPFFPVVFSFFPSGQEIITYDPCLLCASTISLPPAPPFTLLSTQWTRHKYMVFIYKSFHSTKTYILYTAYLPCGQCHIVCGCDMFEVNNLAERIKHWSLLSPPQEVMTKAVLFI